MNLGRGMEVAHNWQLLDTLSAALGVEEKMGDFGRLKGGPVPGILKNV